MNDYPKISEGIMGEQDTVKSNTELFLELVGQYFPEAIKDGEVDFNALKEEMGEFAEISAEHYNFTWAGKQAAKKEAQTDLFGKTLRYKPQDSLNPDNTENIYIEGDNLEALKLLRRNYHGKIKMIYIDPPYNTGSDFIYHDDFSMTEDELAKLSGDMIDGVRFQKNTKDSARYHTNWLNMMYPRLKIAKNLLSEDGVILISIDEHEDGKLKGIMDEIYGEKNFIGNIIWEATTQPINAGSARFNLQKKTETILMYGKNKLQILGFALEEMEGTLSYPHTGKFGACRFEIIEKSDSGGYNRPTMKFKILGQYPRNGKRWQIGEDTARQLEKEGKIEIIDGIVKKAVYPEDEIDKKQYKPFWSLFSADSVGTAQTGKEELNSLLKKSIGFDTVKPVNLISNLVSYLGDNIIILDFFSGSATTAHAVMQLNAEDGGNRKFIMVQFPEKCDEKSEAYKAGYENICEIGKERIRRAAKKIHEDKPDAVFDDGFKVFEVGGTNIRWNTADDNEVKNLPDEDYTTNNTDRLDFTPGYNDIDIVYEIMLRQYGIPLSTPIERLTQIGGRTYIFADAVVVCLEPEINDTLIEKLAAIDPTPAKFILRDSAFNDDIALKDLSFRKLSALIKNHQTEEERKSKYNNYTVEFI